MTSLHHHNDNRYQHNQDYSSFLFKKVVNNIVISKLIFSHVYAIHRSLSSSAFRRPALGKDLLTVSLAEMLRYGRDDLFFENIDLLVAYYNVGGSTGAHNKFIRNSQFLPLTTLKEAMLTGNLRVVIFLMENIKALGSVDTDNLLTRKELIHIVKQGFTAIFNIILSLNINKEHIIHIIEAITLSHRYNILASLIQYLKNNDTNINPDTNTYIDTEDEDEDEEDELDQMSDELTCKLHLGTEAETTQARKLVVKINETLESDAEKTYDLMLRYHRVLKLKHLYAVVSNDSNIWLHFLLTLLETGEYKAAALLFKRKRFKFCTNMLKYASDYDNQLLQLVLHQFSREEITVPDSVISAIITRGDIDSFITILEYTELTEGQIQQALLYRSSIEIINYIINNLKPSESSEDNHQNIDFGNKSNKWQLDDIYYQYCHVDILKRLVNNRYFDCRFRFLLATAIENHLVEVINYIMDNMQLFQIDYSSAISAAIVQGNLEVLSALIKLSPTQVIDVPDPYSGDNTHSGKIDGNAYIAAIQMVLNSSLRINVTTDDIFFFFQRRLALYPFLEQVFRILHQHGVIEHNDSTIDITTFPLSSSIWELLEEMPINYSELSVYNCAAQGSLELFRYLIERHQQPCPPSALKAASERGFIEIVKYIVEHNLLGEHYVIDALRRSIECGYLDQITYLIEHKLTPHYFKTTLMKPKYVRQSLKYPEILEYLLPSCMIDLQFLLRFLMTVESDAHKDAFSIVFKHYMSARSKIHPQNGNDSIPFIKSTPTQLVKHNQYSEIQSIFDCNLVLDTHRSQILNEMHNLSMSYGHIKIIKLVDKLNQ